MRSWLVTSTAVFAHVARSVRKQIKIRPGFTPQEDVSRFRGTRQQAMDTAALPKGHILGWVAPSSESQQKAKGAGAPPPNKNAKKRANQRARKVAEKGEQVKDNWEDEEDVEGGTGAEASAPKTAAIKDGGMTEAGKAGTQGGDKSGEGETDVVDKLSKLKV